MVGMLRDLRTTAIFAGLLVAVFGGALAVRLAGPSRGRVTAAAAGPSAGKLVALSLAAEEIVIGLDGPDRLAAVTEPALNPRFSNVAAEAAGRPVVSGTSVERIVRLRPELVIVAPYTDDAARALERFGLRLLRLPDPVGFASIEDGILRIGDAIGRRSRAEEMVAALRARLAAARARVPAGAARPRVLRYDPADAWVAGTGTVIDEVIRQAGAVNVAAENGVAGTRVLRRETVVRWNPDVLLVEGEPEEKAPIAARLRADPVLEPVAAIRRLDSGGLVVLPTRTLAAVSHHAAGAVEALVAALYGPPAGNPGRGPPAGGAAREE